MSPLLGAVGDSSEYAYRGNIDDDPDDFILSNVTGVNPGVAVTTGPITITGINNRVKVTVGSAASVSINSGIFTSGPAFVTSGETVSVLIQTTSGSDSDFKKSYITQLEIGKLKKEWRVTTRDKDTLPNTFSFTNSVNQELGVTATSNTITLSGLETTLPTNISITSGSGSFTKNGGSPVTSDTVINSDTIAAVLTAPTDYSKTNTTALTVGTYTTTFSVSTRPADTTVDQFIFTNLTDVGISSAFDSNPITLTGADNNTAAAPVPLTAAVSGGFFKVERGAVVVRDFGISTATVYNGDILTVKVNSSPDYSTSTSAILSITGVNDPVGISSTFTVTTRPVIVDTIPKQFNFVDISNQSRNISVISDPITLTEMSLGATDFGTAELTNNIDGGQFRVTRGGVVVRDFSVDSTTVRDGDVIDLKITTSPASGGSVQTRFNVTGIDNNDLNNIVTQTINDTWVVQSAVRNCPLTAPTFANIDGVEPASLQSVTFTPTSYDNDCGVAVSTSNPNSYLSVDGVDGNNLEVLPGVACTVYMTAGTFSETRTTTVTLTANNNVPTPISTSSDWSVTTRAINTPTISLTATPSSLTCGESTTLDWTSTGAVSVTTNGFTGVGTIGSANVGPLRADTTYSITATGSDGTTATSSVTVPVTSTATATLSADSTNIPYRGSVTLTWSSTNSSSVVSNFGATATSGSVTLTNLTSSQTYTIRAVSNDSCADSPTQSVTVNVGPCSPLVTTSNAATGVTLSYTEADAGDGNGFLNYFSGLSGSSINLKARTDTTISDSLFYETSTVDDGDGASVLSTTWTVPSGVTSFSATCVGAGGGGGGGGASFGGGGGGGGGLASATINTSPGTTYIVTYGGGGRGAPSGSGGNDLDPGAVAAGARRGYTGRGASLQTQFGTDILRGRGGSGGGRGSASDTTSAGTGGGSVNTISGGTSLTGSNGTGTNNANGGARGANYRPGGNGGNRNTAGANGSPAYVLISYSVTIVGATWNELISGINDQYSFSYNRPATDTEMDFWITSYTNFTYNTVADIQSAISVQGNPVSPTGAIDECGDLVI